MTNPVIAIDGPSGSGKSTTAQAVASQLGLPVLDTGAMYRAVALLALDTGVKVDDGDAVARLARACTIEVDRDRTHLDGRDVSREIRGPAVTEAVSAVARHPGVREELVSRQRAWVAQHGGGVVEGRDIGTVVFPTAVVKVYLEARETTRAERRRRDEEAADRAADVDEVRAALAKRDAADSTRAASPLAVAEDAMILDTTGRSVSDVADEIVARFRAAKERS